MEKDVIQLLKSNDLELVQIGIIIARGCDMDDVTIYHYIPKRVNSYSENSNTYHIKTKFLNRYYPLGQHVNQFKEIQTQYLNDLLQCNRN
jgi:hypothetical protein